MTQFGIPSENQLEMFDPMHVALKKQADALQEQINPTLVKIHELKKRAFALCPHENISYKYHTPDDEYGRGIYDSREIHLTCDFCGKRNHLETKTIERFENHHKVRLTMGQLLTISRDILED